MDHIRIKDLEIYAKHGVFKEEQKLGQKFLVSVDLYTDTVKAGRTDDLSCSIDYGNISQLTEEFLTAHTYKLIETAAEQLAREILRKTPLAKEVEVTIKKPWAPIGLPLDTASITIHRKWHQAVIAFGSNMGDREQYIKDGIKIFEETDGVKVLKVSKIIETEPVGEVEQGLFLNGCMKIKTFLSPEEILEVCHKAEQNAKRERMIHWGPRTLDMDIICYDDLVMEEEDLVIPHPYMTERTFVLEPMTEIFPNWRHPVLLRTTSQLLSDLKESLKKEKENKQDEFKTAPWEIEHAEKNGEEKKAYESFEMLDVIPKEGVKVVFQGVPGAYSQAAMKQYFGEKIDSFSVTEWEDACQAVLEEKADYAVLPIENSNAGAVLQVYDLLIQHDTYIVGEIYLPISHALLGLPGSELSDIRVVYSHPQALMQCAKHLGEHKDWKQISLLNTAVSAKKVLNDQDPTQAAIASEISAELYGLKILEKGVNDNPNNITRFIVISKKCSFLKEAGKVSICVELNHESGSLYKLLSYISIYGLNMTKIESRPIPNKNFEYRFFIDFEGNISSARVQSALRGISQESNQLWFLGNY